MPYLYDLHSHTKEGSACSTFPVREMVRFYKAHGYAGFLLTDHFSGNSTFPPSLPWKERIDRFYGIYETAAEEAEKLGGIRPFFGMEFSLRSDAADIRRCTGNDFVIFNLTKEWILDNEDAFGLDPRAGFDKIRAAGGFVIHAHPFLEAEWVRSIQLLPRHVDAVEIHNGGVGTFTDGAAKWYAGAYDLPVTGGSDIHFADWKTLCGVESAVPLDTSVALAEAIRTRAVTVFRRSAEQMPV